MNPGPVQARILRSTGSEGFAGSGIPASGCRGDEDIREGIRTRKAYGGSATRSAFAVLCELNGSPTPGGGAGPRPPDGRTCDAAEAHGRMET